MTAALARALGRLRTRYHPLHRLRRRPWFRAIIQLVDFPVWFRLWYVAFPVRIRWLRNATHWLTNPSPEPEILALFIALQRLLQPNIFWDLGANVGIYSWLMKSLDPRIRVVLLEPDPDNCCLLRETRARTTWLGDVDIREMAASSRSGVVSFGLDLTSSETGSVLSGGRSFSEEHYGILPTVTTVEAVALDELAGAGSPDIIKVDTEGHENEVFRGAVAILRRASPVLIFECFDQNCGALSTLEALDYLLLDAERLELADDGRFFAHTTNFLALPPRLADRLPALLADWKEAMAMVQSRKLPVTPVPRD